MVITAILCILIFYISFYQIKIKMPDLYWRLENPEMMDSITYSVELFFIMAISWLSNHLINKSLIQARSSEKRLRAELERINRIYHFAEFGKLSSGAFHDLMNPLTSISLSIKELNDTLDPRIKETKRSLEKALKASNRMQNFIEAVEKQIKPSDRTTTFILNHEIEQAMELVSYKARRANCEFIFTANKNISLFGNALSFYQTMTNLLSNAVDSYEGVITDNKIIKINLIHDAERVFIEISDRGVGIEPFIMGKIFEPFFTTKSFHKGIGLGLSASKERIEKEFDGKISVSCSPLNGTIFTISLPKRNSLKAS